MFGVERAKETLVIPNTSFQYVNFSSQVFNFLNKKSQNALLMRRNPRKITWTVLYRRKHRKGTQEEVTKKRTRRNVKFQRSVQGATLENILAKRNQKPEVRKAQREQAIRYKLFVVGRLSLCSPEQDCC